MTSFSSSEKSRVLDYLSELVDTTLLQTGIELSSSGSVRECSKSGSVISGTIQTEDEDFHASADILSSREVKPSCTCQTTKEKTWCPHAVALLVRANALGFLSLHSGFPAQEATYRVHSLSATEIAQVLRDLTQPLKKEHEESLYNPKVSIGLLLEGDRLGIQVKFDGEPQEVTVFEQFRKISGRALDNLLVHHLEDQGAWDEDRRCWYVNSSEHIEVIFGLLSEYKEINSLRSGKQIRFADHLLRARLDITWSSQGAELAMQWLLPDETLVPKDQDLIGNGPYWTAINNTIYRISPAAAQMATLFPYGSSLTLSRSQVGPLLEVLQDPICDYHSIEIHDAHLQPSSEIKAPTPSLEVERRDFDSEHFSNNRRLELSASLDFEYPNPPSAKNVVYLPDRALERSYGDFLASLGFEYSAEKRRYLIQGDIALDLLKQGPELFPKPWRINGLDQIRKSVRFSDAQIAVSISTPTDLDSDTKLDRGSLKSIDWFDCQVSLLLNNAHVPLSTLFKGSASDKDRWVRLESGAFVKVPGGSLGQLKMTLGLLDPQFRLSNRIKAKLSTAQAVGLSRLADSEFSVQTDKALKKLGRQLDDFAGIEPLKVSRSFKGSLRPYQAEGLGWLHFLFQFQLGGILADEMGLGKTIQTLALLQTLKDKLQKSKKKLKPALVVAPTSVVTNWWYEAKRFTPQMNVLLLQGAERKALFSQIPENDIVITSYALLRLDRYELEKHAFGYLILDEAQHIKNFQAATTIAAKNLRSEHRLALSGTPTENRPMELWSLMDFLMPGYLGTHDFFKSQIEKPILELGTEATSARVLKSKVKPFILRRKKQEVEKDLPPKIESIIHSPMTPSQRDLYAHILEEVRPRVFDAVNKKGIAGASVSILAALLRLRQVCNHPNSIDALKDLPGYDSGKFNALKELLAEALDSGRKILLFAQFREMLSIIKRYLEEKNVNYVYLDGTTRDRQPIIDKFNNDENVRLFLISLKAGGLGLNLTAADMVILYDPWWNPAVENQAVDRAHRIGQKRTVYVYRLITEDSIEQKIMDLKRKKSMIVNAIINEQGVSTLALSKQDLENLFSPLVAEVAPADEME